MAHPSTPTADPANPLLYPDTRTVRPYVLRVDEIFSGREGDQSSRGPTAVRNYVRKFRVLLTGATSTVIDQWDETDILKDARVPRPWASYFSNWSGIGGTEGGSKTQLADLDALAIEHNLARELQEDSNTWILTVKYSTDVGPQGPDYRIMFGGTQANEHLTNPNSPQFYPWYQKPEYEWGTAESTVAKQWDLSGAPFLNSAGQPFAPAPMVEEAYPVLTIIRNEQTWNADTSTYWSYAVNNATFMGYPIDCVQILPPSVKVLWHGRTKYYRATWRLRFKPTEVVNIQGTGLAPASWQAQLLDSGFYRVKTPPVGPPVVVPIYRHGHRVSNQPALLDGAGDVLASGDDPVYIQFQTRNRRDFSTLFNVSLVP